jgi:hypothetical protein
MDDLAEKLDLKQVMDRNVENLSGGELQRFAIAMCAAGKADVYMVDEPSSYLDVRQRLKAAQVRCASVLSQRLTATQPCTGMQLRSQRSTSCGDPVNTSVGAPGVRSSDRWRRRGEASEGVPPRCTRPAELPRNGQEQPRN